MSSDFTFLAAGASTRCVTIPILDDDALEDDKAFTVTLTTLDPNVILGIDMTTITINDDDG